MYATDFIFDDVSLSSKGYMICSFDGTSDLNIVEAGSPIVPVVVQRNKGKKNSIVDLRYEGALEITFDICKDSCTHINSNDMEITDAEFLELSRWLLRHEFKPLHFLNEKNSIERHYYALFNFSKIMIDDRLIGLRLIATTDKPFAYGEPIILSHTFTSGASWELNDASPLVGTIRPMLTINCNEAGDLSLTNSFLDINLVIKNCSAGEVITIDGDNLIISSSLSSHNIWEDFNYQFFQIGNTETQITNTIISSLACTIQLTYRPILRDMS